MVNLIHKSSVDCYDGEKIRRGKLPITKNSQKVSNVYVASTIKTKGNKNRFFKISV